jgi:hypothetical protein
MTDRAIALEELAYWMIKMRYTDDTLTSFGFSKKPKTHDGTNHWKSPTWNYKRVLIFFGTEWGSGVSYPIKSALTSGGSLLDDTPPAPSLPMRLGKKTF